MHSLHIALLSNISVCHNHQTTTILAQIKNSLPKTRNTFYWNQTQSTGSPPNINKRKISNTTSSISHPTSSKGTLPCREKRIQPHNKQKKKNCFHMNISEDVL